MQRHPEYTRERLRLLSERLQRSIYRDHERIFALEMSGPVGRIPYAAATKLEYRDVSLGEQLGPLWSTFWFRGRIEVPADWRRDRVDLLWISHSEATLWLDGKAVQGLNHDPGGWDRSTRPDAILLDKARGGETIDFMIEMACNRPFGMPINSLFNNVSPFVLDRCDIARFDREAWDLYHDFRVLQQLEAELAKEAGTSDRTWAGQLLAELNRFANTYEDDRRTWAKARRILKPLYATKNPSSTHQLSAIGHAHLDTAWLWPLAETHRKCVRTFSSATTYMRDYPEYRFACSQAYQYDVVKREHPDLYRRMQRMARRGQFVPVGGTWVEPDCNLPSGESLVRQFLQGQRFFEREFGARCREFWNPDVFGYNGQLPQIMRGAGISRFLTQKLSWNRFNKPAHHTFTWEGLDGSQVLAHFPPADTYNATVSIPELRANVRDFKDHDRSRESLMLFGHGDGGGGPTKAMLETLRRIADLQGLPRTAPRSSSEFFARLEKDCDDLPTIIGELYFEYHRGTYTTQAATKRSNRKCEWLLHDVEFLAAWAAFGAGKRRVYPRQQLAALWKSLLLHQFHDIIPGSSIYDVYADAAVAYALIEAEGTKLREQELAALGANDSGDGSDTIVINTLAWPRREVITAADGSLDFAEAPSYGIGAPAAAADAVRVRRGRTTVQLENQHLRAVLGVDGRLRSLVHKASGRETMAATGNVFELYEDRPNLFDAWDVDPFHLETGKPCVPGKLIGVRRDSPLRAEVEFVHSVGKGSRLTQVVRLDAESPFLEFHTQGSWYESHSFLKVAFPVQVRAMNATYEMQFGNAERPTHYNTSFDLARYEVPAHKWADLSEHGFGVALLSESKYGFSTFGNTMRISLLRASKLPDPAADMGEHRFSYAVMPHAGGWRDAGVVAAAHRFNVPLLVVAGSAPVQSMASVDDPNLVLDTIKLAEDDDALVLRFYEAHGARGRARVRLGLPIKSVRSCNLLEDEGEPVRVKDGSFDLEYGPYQILSVKVR